MSSAVVVGHGPSLKGAGLGSQIDACDWVIRLKDCGELLKNPEDYGTRTDVMCSTTEVISVLPKIKAKEYWGHPKRGHFDRARVEKVMAGLETYVPLELCNFWNEFFRQMGASHPNVSTGMAAVIIALEKLPVDTVCLAGFDKVLRPESEGYVCTVPTRFNSGGTKDTGHDWKKENELLSYLASFYEKEIKAWKRDARGNDILPEGVRAVRKEDVGGDVPLLLGPDGRVL